MIMKVIAHLLTELTRPSALEPSTGIGNIRALEEAEAISFMLC